MYFARRLQLAAAVILVALSGGAAWSQATRTITVIVPYQPGGATDVLARVLAEQIGRAQGPTMLIENRPGASTIIGTEAVSRAAPNGTTLLITDPSFLINPHLRKVNYDPVTSLEPICHLASSPLVIAVNSASAYRTLADLFDAARAKPGYLTLAAAGPASITQITFEILKHAANVDMNFIPYPGGAPSINALLGEHVTSAFTDYPPVAEQLKSGKLRALATTSRTRIESLPEVPTVSESVYKDFEADNWFGLYVPAKTPRQSVSQLSGWFTAALEVPEVKAKLVGLGLFPVGMCGADFSAFVHKKYEEYGHAIRELNIKVN
jgi:tripartite-type tricarboxylate transporter receptor subunit TctC